MLYSFRLSITALVLFILRSAMLFSQDTSLLQPSQSYSPLLAVQLTHPRFYDATLSPDGKWMIYLSVVNDKEQLFLSGIDGRAARQLTTDTADHEDPAWSPDGKYVVYVLGRDSTEALELMDMETGGRKMITPPGMRVIHPSWASNSKQVLFCTDDDLHPPYKNTSEIISLDILTGKMKVIISGGTNTFPVLSPDGKTIAFRKIIDGNNSEIFTASADGTNQRNVTVHPSFDGWPSWSPDGNWIAFASNRNANYQVFVMDKSGRHVYLAANTEGRATVPVWAPDGHTIYFTNCKKVDFGRDCNIYFADVKNLIAGH